jgi:hypothetical protein
MRDSDSDSRSIQGSSGSLKCAMTSSCRLLLSHKSLSSEEERPTSSKVLSAVEASTGVPVLCRYRANADL